MQKIPSLADQCKAIRKLYSCSQSELARLVGSSQAAISFIERGALPDERLVQRIQSLYCDCFMYS